MSMAVAVMILLICLVSNLAFGAANIPLEEVTRAFIANEGSTEHLIIRTLRLPRTLVAFCVGVALAMARELNALSLGDEVARGLGSAIEWRRGILLVTSVALASASVATAGGIGFVGLMAPHFSRLLVGGTHEGQLPTAAMMGGMLVVIADLLGRMVFPPIELPCGLITAAVGAPFFVYVLIRKR